MAVLKDRSVIPTSLDVILDGIPKALQNLNQWVLWRWEWKQDSGQDDPNKGAWGKVPKQVNGRNAKSDAASTWNTFAAVAKCYEKGGYSGIGIAFEATDGVGLVGIDVDHYPNELEYKEFAEYFKDTYLESSPSGKLRGFAFGVTTAVQKGVKNKKLEIYDNRKNRYLTVTGHKLNDNDVIECQDVLDVVIAKHFTRGVREKTTIIPSAVALTDSQINACMAKMLSSPESRRITELMNGDTSSCDGDDSAADFTLCLKLSRWLCGDAQAIDKVFRTSKLLRPKWDERRGEEGTYGSTMIAKILASRTEYHRVPEKWECDLADHVSYMNTIYASTMMGGKHRIMEFVQPSEATLWRDDIAYYARKELATAMSHTRIKVGVTDKDVSIYRDHITAWSEHPLVRRYLKGVMFAPGKDLPDGYYNLWQGFAINPVDNFKLLEPIKAHLRDVICGGKMELYHYHLNWIAYAIQNLDRPIGTAIVIRGEKGVGKGTLAHFLMSIFGKHAMQVNSSCHLTGKFNSHLKNVCLLYADEAFYAGDKVGEAVLKGLITEPTITIEPKGLDAYSMSNYLKIIMTTNSDYAVPATKDERRFCVIDASSSKKGDTAYFDMLHKCTSSTEVQQAFLHEMLHMDISGFNPGSIPESEGLMFQRFSNFDYHQKWLANYLGCRLTGDVKVEWDDAPTLSSMYTFYKDWCMDNRRTDQYHLMEYLAFSHYMRKVFSCYKSKRKETRDKVVVSLGTLAEALKTFESHEKVSITEMLSYTEEV